MCIVVIDSFMILHFVSSVLKKLLEPTRVYSSLHSSKKLFNSSTLYGRDAFLDLVHLTVLKFPKLISS